MTTRFEFFGMGAFWNRMLKSIRLLKRLFLREAEPAASESFLYHCILRLT